METTTNAIGQNQTLNIDILSILTDIEKHGKTASGRNFRNLDCNQMLYFISKCKTLSFFLIIASLLMGCNGGGGTIPKVGSAHPSLSWSSVSLSADGRKILDRVSGEAYQGRLLGILGPSGAGKTSCLQVLAGVLPHSRGLQLRGEMGGSCYRSGEREAAAFVGQEDRFHSQLSVRETLSIAAQLRLPAVGRLQRCKIVEDLLRQLHLSHISGSKVGDARCRGISGGERRRLALGCELVGRPGLIFADEPTSGLDAFQAERMMEALRDLSEQGHTVIVSIHQPSSKIWRMLDDVMLMSDGKCCYIGTREECLPYFAKQGSRCPPETNPAEFLLDLVSVDYSTIISERTTAGRVEALACKLRESRYHKICTDPTEEDKPGPARWLRRLCAWARNQATGGIDGGAGQRLGGMRRRGIGRLWPGHAFGVLFTRAVKQTLRDVFVNGMRMVATVALAGTFGAVWGEQSTVIERTGTIVMASVNSAMIAMVKSLTLLVEERPAVRRERRFYGALPYLLSKILAEGPLDAGFAALFGSMVHDNCHMLGDKATFVTALSLQALSSSALGHLIGACVPSPATALASGPPLMVVLTIVGAVGPQGRPGLPFWLDPFRHVSAIRWGCEALCVSELTAQELSGHVMGKAVQEAKKAAFLKRLGLGGCTVQGAIMGQLKLLAGCYAVTLGALIASRPRPQPMLPPIQE